MAQNTLTYLCLKENVICLQPRRDKLPGLQREREAELKLRRTRAVLVCYYWKTMCWKFACYLFNIVDIFRGLTNKKKPKYYGKHSKCGILVLCYMIVGIKLEWIAFHNRGLLYVTEGEYFILFLIFFLFIVGFSALQCWPGVRVWVKGWVQDLYIEPYFR